MRAWPRTPVLQVATLVSNRVEPFEGKRKYVATGGLDGGTLVAVEDVCYGSKPSRADVVAEPGDVLFARMQATNKVVQVTDETCDYIWSTGFAALHPGEHVRSRYLMHYLTSPNFQYAKDALCTGSTQKSLTNEGLTKIAVPLPSLAEQDGTIEILDDADVLQKLRVEADRRTDELIPNLFYEMFGDTAHSLKHFPVKPFGELALNQDGRRKPVKASDRRQRQGDFPYYGASGIIDFVDEYLFDETALLIAEDGANLLARSTPIAFLASGKYWVNNHAHVVTSNGRANLQYLCTALNLRNIADYVTGSAQPKLNQANLNRIPILVPPLSAQEAFAEQVFAIHNLKADQAASRQRLEALFQSLLHNAFNGGL